MANEYDNIDLKVLLDYENENLLISVQLNDANAIPKLISIDKETWEVMVIRDQDYKEP